jgi:hypothetical protein
MIENPASHPWFLRKHEDGSIFGPITFEQLAAWAASAQIAPQDAISTDQENWSKAPMLPGLGMDWIAEVTSESLYGPTTLGAVREFLKLGEIDENTFLINACDATRHQVRDVLAMLPAEPAADGSVSGEAPAAPGSIVIALAADDRIRELEQALREERRALADAEERYRELEAKYNQLLDLAAASRTSAG